MRRSPSRSGTGRPLVSILFFTPRHVKHVLDHTGWASSRWGSSGYGRLGGLTYPIRRRTHGAPRRALDGLLAGQLYVVAVSGLMAALPHDVDSDTS